MRLIVPLTLALALATLAAPAASARAGAALTLEGPAQAASGQVPYRLTLELSDFSCRHDRWVVVHMAANGTAPGLALGAEKIAFLVPEGSYLAQPYRGTADSWLRASGAGTATVTATLGDDLDDCFTAGDLPAASASWNVTFTGGPGAGPAPGEPAPVPTPPPASSPTPAPSSPPAASTLPPGAGYIGEMGPVEAAQERDTPGPGAALLVAACAAGAILMRRSR
jgi:hypothetical protein